MSDALPPEMEGKIDELIAQIKTEALELMEEILDPSADPPPTMAEIEARILQWTEETNQELLDKLIDKETGKLR